MNQVLAIPAWGIFTVLMVAMLAGSGNSNWGVITAASVLISWLYLIGMSVNRFIPDRMKFSQPLFIFRLLFALIYIIAVTLVFDNEIPNYVVPFHLVATFCIFSCLWTCARSIVIGESQKNHSFDRYIGSFFLLWFFPIGVWIIQPKLNKLYKSQMPT